VKSRKKHIIIGSLLVLIVVILAIGDLLTGSVEMHLKDIFRFFSGNVSGAEPWYDSFRLFRIPRVITAILVGAGLSVAGLLMQSLFRNPLAGPYILGISSGASLGVAIAVLGAGFFGVGIMQSGLSELWLVLSAAAGSLLIMLLVAVIAIRQQDIMTLLVLGVLIGSAVSAIVGLMQYMSQAGELKLYVLWTMGSLRSVSLQDLNYLIPVIGIGILMAWLISGNLNLLLLGEDAARSLGARIQLTRFVIFVSVSLLAGGITAFCGPIGFIGIAVPHIVRTIFKSSDHRVLIPWSIIAGAGIMLGADILSNPGGGNIILPINSITALIGIPFVIWLIISKRKSFFQ
jgi:iron complex transport system permease protein